MNLLVLLMKSNPQFRSLHTKVTLELTPEIKNSKVISCTELEIIEEAFRWQEDNIQIFEAECWPWK